MHQVADVVGPPYSIETITPTSGPITGSTRGTIKVRLISLQSSCSCVYEAGAGWLAS
jgi:hypothetical protein